jgi:tol-pal system protein YbgF
VSNPTTHLLLLASLGLLACGGGNQVAQRDLDRMKEQLQQLRGEVDEGAARIQVLERQIDGLVAQRASQGGGATNWVLPGDLRVVRVEPQLSAGDADEEDDEDSYAYIALAPSSPAAPAPSAPRGLGHVAAPPLPTSVELAAPRLEDGAYEEGDRLFSKGKVQEAIASFERFLEQAPDDPRADNALLAMGEAWLSLGMPGRALEAFEAVVTRYPAGDAVPQALLRYGETTLALGSRATARAAFQRLIERFPRSPAAVQARARLGHLDQGEEG